MLRPVDRLLQAHSYYYYGENRTGFLLAMGSILFDCLVTDREETFSNELCSNAKCLLGL